MKNLFSSFRTGIATAVLAVVLFSSCRKTDNNYVAPDVAGVMAFNLVSDINVAGIGIAFTGENITPVPLAYAGYTGAYLSVYPGSYTIQSYNSGGYQNPLAASGNTLLAKKYYSLFVTGANGVYGHVVSEDKFDSLPTSNGQAYIRYINAIPDSTDPRVTITANGTAVANSTVHYQTLSPFTAVAPGQLAININNDGNIQSNRTITVEAQKAYTILLTGLPGSTDANKAVQIKFIENGRLTP